MFARANGVGDPEILNTAEHHDIAGASSIDFVSLQPLEAIEFEQFSVACRSVGTDDYYRIIAVDVAARNSPDTEHAYVGVIIEAGYL